MNNDKSAELIRRLRNCGMKGSLEMQAADYIEELESRNAAPTAAQPLDLDKLLPCPFCGGTETFVERLDYSAAYVQCDSRIDEHCACLARGPVGVQDDDGEEIPGGAAAVRAWNNQAALIAQARAARPEGAADTTASASIDTPEFMDLLCEFYEQASCEEFDPPAYDTARKAIVEYIDSRATLAPIASTYVSAPASQVAAQQAAAVRNNVPGSPHNICRLMERNLISKIEELEAKLAAKAPAAQAVDVRKPASAAEGWQEQWDADKDGLRLKYGMMKTAYETELSALRQRSSIPALVNRFLAWPLPASLTASMHLGIEQPVGTHLMNADEAKAMFEYCLASPASTPEASQQAAIGSSASELECLQVKYGLMKTTYEVEIAQLRGSQAEPIYQVQFVEQSGTSAWNDATEDAYNTFMPERRRIVYPATTAAAATECEACEVKTSEDIQSSTDARDAARYRWLRAQPYYAWKRIGWNTMEDAPFVFTCRDEAIDVAMRAHSQEKPQQEGE